MISIRARDAILGDYSIIDALRRNAIDDPDRLAIEDGSLRLSRITAYESAIALARTISATVPAGEAVGIALGNDALFPIAAFACAAAGCPHVALDRRYPIARNIAIAERAGVRAIIRERARPFDSNDRLGTFPTIALDRDSLSLHAPNGDVSYAPRPLAPTDPFALLFTSGSTGVPKGVAHSQRSLLSSIRAEAERLQLTAQDRVLSLWSPATMGGARAMVASAYLGSLAIVRDPQDGLARVVSAMTDERPTVWRAVPTLIRAIARLDDSERALASLRVVQFGGDRTYGSDIELLRPVLPPLCRISITFGSTEAGVVAQWFVDDASVAPGLLPSGSALSGTTLEIVSESGEAFPAGVVGELRVCGPTVGLGMWDACGLVAQSMPPVAGDSHARIARTGDLCSVGGDGLLVHAGRLDRMVKLLGRRVDLGDVEAALRADPSIVDAAVVATTTEPVRITAFVVLVRETRTLDDVECRLRQVLPAHMLPSAILPLDAIPVLPGFKHDVGALRRRADAMPAPGAERSAFAPSATPIGRAVTRAWSELLGAESLGRNARWSDAGGDSLQLLQLAFVLERKLGFAVALETFTSTMRPTDLIARLHVADGSDPTSVSESAPTIVVLPGIAGDEPKLVDFRAALRADARVIAVSYRSWDALVRTRASFASIVDDVRAQIVARAPAGAISLVGYSFGGVVGHGVARRLRDEGRDVITLAIIDSHPAREIDASQLSVTTASPRLSIGARGKRLRANIGADGTRTALALAIARRLADTAMAKPTLRNAIARVRRYVPLPTAIGFEFDYRMTQGVRLELARARDLATYDGPAHFYRASSEPQDGREGTWRELTPNIESHVVEGTHESMIANEAGERLAREIRASIDGSIARID